MPRRSYFCPSSAELDNVPMNGIGLVSNNAGQLIPYEWNGTAWVQIDIGDLPSGPGGSSWGSITGTLANQTDLQTALSGKANTHTHPYASDTHNHDAAYAPVSHTHSTADVTGLDAALAGKASTGHNHDASYAAIGHNHTGTYEPANANIQTHVASAHAPANAQKNSDILKSEIEAVLTGVIASHSHSDGSDPWTYVN